MPSETLTGEDPSFYGSPRGAFSPAFCKLLLCTEHPPLLSSSPFGVCVLGNVEWGGGLAAWGLGFRHIAGRVATNLCFFWKFTFLCGNFGRNTFLLMAQTYSNDYYEPVKDFFHCYTDGNCADVMFPDSDAKVHGMNIIPALALRVQVVVIAFVLMDNHVHFCLQGSEAACRRFIQGYVFSVSNYIAKRFAGEYKRGGFKWSALPVTTKIQLMKTVTYIFRNPLMAGFDRMPSEYPWSNAADCFIGKGWLMNMQGNTPAAGSLRNAGNNRHIPGGFAMPVVGGVAVDWPVGLRGSPVESTTFPAESSKGYWTISALGPTERRTLLKVRHEYPGDWLVDERGVILTAHYTDWRFVERQVFGNVRRYLYYLASKCEEEVNDTMFRSQGKFLSDSDVRLLAKSLSQETFRRQDIRKLPLDHKVRLVRVVKKKIGCSNSQLARILGTPVKDWVGFV